MAEKSLIKRFELLVIGGSAGSLEPLLLLLPLLSEVRNLAVVLVLHRGTGESLLPELLSHKTPWPVKEADEKELIEPGTVYVAPSDYHLLIEKDKTFSLDYSEKVHYSRPAIDVTFETAAEVYGAAVIGLLLSGANHDGTAGLIKIQEHGGYVMVQDPLEAFAGYMPQHAAENVPVHKIVTIAGAAAEIKRLLRQQR